MILKSASIFSEGYGASKYVMVPGECDRMSAGVVIASVFFLVICIYSILSTIYSITLKLTPITLHSASRRPNVAHLLRLGA